MIALFSSVVFRKTSISLMTSYLIVILLYCMPVAVAFFAREFTRAPDSFIEWVGVSSPFAASFAVPLDMDLLGVDPNQEPSGNWGFVAAHALFALALNLGLLSMMIWLFNVRWRVSK